MAGRHWLVRGLFLGTILAALLCAPTTGLARRGYDLSRVLKMGDRAKARLPKRVLNQAVHKYGLKAVALRQTFVNKHNPRYKVTIPKPKTYKVRDQLGSGNCWLFASGRVLASKLHKQNKHSPMLSASFINYHSMRQTAFALLKEAAKAKGKDPQLNSVEQADEGGFQIWAMDIIKRKGFVPETKMPMTADAAHPLVYINRLQSMLAKAQHDFTHVKKGPKASAQRKALLKKYTKQVDSMLDTAIGKPPKQFTYEGKRYTPRTFANRFLGLKKQNMDYVALTHYTDRGWNKHYKEGDAPGMKAYDQFNVSISVMQQAVKNTLRSGEAVLFGVNVDKHHPYRADTKHDPKQAKGILSVSAFNYDNLIPGGRLSKRARLKNGLLPANHAMAITGYDPGKKRGSVLKWKVENSHGTSAGDKGFFHMYDDYFRQNVDEVVVPRSAIPKHALKKLGSQHKHQHRHKR